MIGTSTVLNSGIQDILQYFVVLRIGIRDDQSRPKKLRRSMTLVFGCRIFVNNYLLCIDIG